MDDPLPRSAPLLLLAAALGCTTPVPPSTRVLGPLDPGLERVLYVTTNRERENVIADLKLAGFEATTDASATPLVLVVSLGSTRATSSCGEVRNVSYHLRQAGVVIAIIKGRGWIGSCNPSILRDMNAALAHIFDARM